MKIEIERKFLLASEDWRPLVERSEYLRDGLFAFSDERKTRVRIVGERATLTVKTPRVHGCRYEFEYDIPLADAELMLVSCGSDTISKHRHYIPLDGLIWEIDEYDGLMSGIVLAEVELDAIDQPISLPAWIGKEVTDDTSFRKLAMLLARQRLLTPETDGHG
jgi:CYTH domain-containing protein